MVGSICMEDVGVEDDAVLVWIKSKITEAESQGSYTTLHNYTEMYDLWKKRILDKGK